jgi:flagellin-like hook-associated protein FlgL
MRLQSEDARGRIVSLDAAEEVANLVQLQTLQQANIALAAQANQSQLLVLELLQGIKIER